MSGAKRHTVLVLDGQTTQALAAIRSLARAGHRVLVASHRRAALGAWSRHCARSLRIPAETPDAFRALRAWAIGEGVSLVMPMTERSCVLCNMERDAWEAGGVIVGCAPTSLLHRAFDKAQTLAFAAKSGVKAPDTFIPESYDECLDAAEVIGFPCIVKPRFSSSWNGEEFLADGRPRYVHDAATLLQAVGACRQDSHWPLIQRIVPGQGKGIFALFDQGEPVVWFAHERLRDVRPTGAGSSLRRSAPLDPRLREPAERLLRAMRWHGPAMVEFRDDGESGPYLMEVNGRFWGSLQLAIAAGVDFPRLWDSVLRRTPLAVEPSYSDVTVRWLWGDIKRFLAILAGPPRGYTGAFPTFRQALAELFGPQPPGTRAEAWERDDPWPALGELVQGAAELANHAFPRKHGARSATRVLAAVPPVARVPGPALTGHAAATTARASVAPTHQYSGERPKAS